MSSASNWFKLQRYDFNIKNTIDIVLNFSPRAVTRQQTVAPLLTNSHSSAFVHNRQRPGGVGVTATALLSVAFITPVDQVQAIIAVDTRSAPMSVEQEVIEANQKLLNAIAANDLATYKAGGMGGEECMGACCPIHPCKHPVPSPPLPTPIHKRMHILNPHSNSELL